MWLVQASKELELTEWMARIQDTLLSMEAALSAQATAMQQLMYLVLVRSRAVLLEYMGADGVYTSGYSLFKSPGFLRPKQPWPNHENGHGTSTISQASMAEPS